MTASDSTPRSGENVSDASNWESIGRLLLRGRLETAADDVREEFFGAASQLRRGDDLGDLDVNELDAAVEEARALVEVLRRVRDCETE